MITRRGALVAAGGSLLAAASAQAQTEDDVRALREAYVAERATEAIYASLGERWEAFAGHEADQAAALATALEALGSRIPGPPTTAGGGLEDAVAQELRAIAALQNAITEVEDGKLLHTLASIMAGSAQHLVLLRRELGEEEVPRPVEPGATI